MLFYKATRKLIWTFLILFLISCLSNPDIEQSVQNPEISSSPIPTVFLKGEILETPTSLPVEPTLNAIELALTADVATQTAKRILQFTPTSVRPDEIQPNVEAFLNEVIEIIQKNALNGDNIDWGSMEPILRNAAKNANSTEDVYPTVQTLLDLLDDNHSFFLTPLASEQLSGATAASNPSVQSKLQSGRLGYVLIPAFSAIDDDELIQHAQTIQSHLLELAHEEPCGWIIDLGANLGGNMYPMLAGLAPFFNDGELGYFVNSANERFSWGIEQGLVTLNDEVMVRLDETAVIDETDKPVAVLIGPNTASSGEAVAISFIGRPNTQLFGEPSYGVSTANELFELSDGSMLVLTVAVMADRTMTAYGEEIQPDVVVARDQVSQAAEKWLLEQPGCAE